MLTEVTHLQEILQQLCLGAGDPYALPASSEQVIRDLKGTDGHTWSFQVRLRLHVPSISPFLWAAPWSYLATDGPWWSLRNRACSSGGKLRWFYVIKQWLLYNHPRSIIRRQVRSYDLSDKHFDRKNRRGTHFSCQNFDNDFGGHSDSDITCYRA